MDKILIAAVCFLTALGCRKPTLDVSTSKPDATEDVLDAEQTEAEAESEPGDALQEVETETEPGDVPQEVGEVEAPPTTLSQEFQKSDGNDGKHLCRGFAVALAPELDSAVCERLSDERRETCYNSRRPLEGFVDILCDTVIAGALLFNLDPVMCLAVIERESSFGRLLFDSVRQTYRVNTDICELYLRNDRILRRAGTDRPGVEELTWTYAGGTGRNSQRVKIVEDTREGLLVNTCVAGETGLLQALPRNYRPGTVVEATGEVLEGSRAELRQRMHEDLVLQINIGLQELASHRDLFPERERSPWWLWAGTYNTGSTTRGEQWNRYTGKIMRHYLDACEGVDVVLLQLWPACAEVRRAYDSFRASL